MRRFAPPAPAGYVNRYESNRGITMRLVRICLLVLFASVAGCAIRGSESIDVFKSQLPVSAKERREAMIGKWLGEATTKEGGVRRWLVQRASDGTHRITFRTRIPGKDWNEQTEVGYWGIAGSTYFTIMKGWMDGQRFLPADASNPYFYDAYKVVRLTELEFEYASEDGTRFSVKKVSPEFTLGDS